MHAMVTATFTIIIILTIFIAGLGEILFSDNFWLIMQKKHIDSCVGKDEYMQDPWYAIAGCEIMHIQGQILFNWLNIVVCFI
jgi:hypothetical protein